MTTADWINVSIAIGTVLVPIGIFALAGYRKLHQSHAETRETVVRQDERLKSLEASQPRQDQEIHQMTTLLQEMRVWMSGQFGAIREALHMQNGNSNPP